MGGNVAAVEHVTLYSHMLEGDSLIITTSIGLIHALAVLKGARHKIKRYNKEHISHY